MLNENQNGFTDPLEEIMDRVKSKDVIAPIAAATPALSTPIEIHREPLTINYGDDDLDKEIERDEIAQREEKIKKAEEVQREHDEHKDVINPPQPYDVNAIASDVDFQGSTLELVSKMVNQVVKDYGLTSGGIPMEDTNVLDEYGNPIQIRQRVMGELVTEYQMNGDIITQKFVSIILDNWVMEDGTSARVFIENRDNPTNKEEETNDETNDETSNTNDVEEEDKKAAININVYNAENTPVNVSIDGNLIENINEEKVVDIYVKHVSEQEMRSAKVIENCETPGIIKPYDPGMSDIPVTLPLSGYRVVLRPMSWLEVLTYIKPPMRTAADSIYKQWSIIYNHIKWTSIGEFKDFEDFMNKTRHADQEFFMWAILVATVSEKETLRIPCTNPKCKEEHTFTYQPRSILKINEDAIPEYYNDADTAVPGEEALKVFNEKASTHTLYRLPESNILIEFEAPSAADFINHKYSRLRKIFYEFYPDGDSDKNLAGIVEMMNSGETDNIFALKLAIAMSVSAVSIPKEEYTTGLNGEQIKEVIDYKYTKWEDIDKILTETLTYDETVILFTKLIPDLGPFKSPVWFELEPFKCKKCGHVCDNLRITNIADQLLLQRAQTLLNTKINLIEQPKNS